MIFLENLQKQFGKKVLFENASFHLRPKEKVGLVGENGMGKTTLFKVITQQEPADSGRVHIRKGARVSFLAQEVAGGDETLLERVLKGDERLERVRREIAAAEAQGPQADGGHEQWGLRIGALHEEYETLGGYGREAKAKEILSGLGFKTGDFEKSMTELSGGWRMRVELARLLLQEPDVLLLDEPTNHLDLGSVVWLEAFLKAHEGSLLLISHDRRFLNSLVGRIVELDRGVLTSYTGNYDDYETQKKENEERLKAQAAGQQRRIAEVERFIERFRAKNTKATQVQSRIKMLNKMERIETAQSTKSIHFRLPQPPRTGRIVLTLDEVDKGYGSVEVYRNFSANLERGWKIALVGENGAGKSTLLKLMAGVLDFQKGEIKTGTNVTRAYYAQHHSESLDASHTVMQSLEEVAGDLLRTEKHNILGAFLFTGDDVEKKVGVLSGGERSRLALARMMASPASLLLLDEPTNHLDMRSTEFLAAALADYEGTLCTISHDRFFLDGIVNRVWEIADNTVREYPGNYSDYQYAKAREAATQPQETAAPAEKKDSLAQKDRERKRREAEARNERHRRLKPLKSRLAEVETRLETVLQEKNRLETELANPTIHNESEKPRLMQTLKDQQQLAGEEKSLMQEWETLTHEIETAGEGEEAQ